MSTQNLLILVGYGDSLHNETQALEQAAEALSQHLQMPVQSAFLEASPSVGESIQSGVLACRPACVIALPLFVGASEAKQQNFRMIVEAADSRGFDSRIYHGKPLGNHPGVISAYSELLNNALDGRATFGMAEKTALLVVARGSRDAASNAAVYPLGRLLYERCRWGSLEVAFYHAAEPDIAAGIRRCVQTGAERIVILPYVLYDTALAEAIVTQATEEQIRYPDVEIIAAPLPGAHNGILNAIIERYGEALAELNQMPLTIRAHHGHSHSHGTHTHAGLQVLLPPRYQGDAPVSAAPMSAADLIYDADGRVAWDQDWGDFCDLALAGGPPHRGTLLEPVAPETIYADPERYQWAWPELSRGIQMITNLPVIMGESIGWIGVECTDEAMALWLLRAIIVENVMVRREDSTLYFPVGPHFRLEGEIKNIITVIAKTHHYWTEHITSQNAT